MTSKRSIFYTLNPWLPPSIVVAKKPVNRSRLLIVATINNRLPSFPAAGWDPSISPSSTTRVISGIYTSIAFFAKKRCHISRLRFYQANTTEHTTLTQILNVPYKLQPSPYFVIFKSPLWRSHYTKYVIRPHKVDQNTPRIDTRLISRLAAFALWLNALL